VLLSHPATRATSVGSKSEPPSEREPASLPAEPLDPEDAPELDPELLVLDPELDPDEPLDPEELPDPELAPELDPELVLDADPELDPADIAPWPLPPLDEEEQPPRTRAITEQAPTGIDMRMP
jgi:protein TonB